MPSKIAQKCNIYSPIYRIGTYAGRNVLELLSEFEQL